MSIPLFKVFMSPSAPKAVGDVLMSGYIGEGKQVEKLEEAFMEACNLPHLPLAVNSGTSALELALFLAGVKPGDKVITTPITCTATTSAILTHYAVPVWADVFPDTGLIDHTDVIRKVTHDVKAIIGVNWGGLQPNYEYLKATGLPVIEDAAHGPYSSSQARGDYVAFSTQAIKFLTTGDGGFLFTPIEEYDNGRLARWFGLDRISSASFRCAQNIKIPGRKLHMNDISATIGLENIKHLDVLLELHRRNAEFYCRELQGLNKVTVLPFNDKSAYWIFTILVDIPARFIAYLKDNDIDASPVHARNDKHDAFYYPNGKLDGVDTFDKHQCSIPVGWWLTDSDRQYVVDVIREYDRKG